ncbi:NADH-quinone oxidoreductase subunit G [Rhodococcus qingshengii]|jgi:NADH-quinone oxidoreductase subunit G|uniref:NADH-quinone oxidoreductase subunit G n=1 Tax=Rhodococcus TaxID=1827 RepID=UPI0002B7E09F|nr:MULTISPECIES: NADH-quinone oxidoreductase subunit G [Rhodococcus]EME16294.1 NADH dehydrogenase subunit G [Rhodococcus qingshengii BKS 20-40]MDJ0486625.1 NADH-quinone oxidoreductase subunit G [Rhodococcus qingshengii]QTS02838.1 NADH-quinone oxidoreductase subunit G [Rhodococcus qingshengii]UEL35583.1 NADH-quinone oxidoreductase subunit G [Rhodococcus sp. C1]BDQ20280.1 NADH-quinone oxidoreductase subunit G [Rhodococcus qingshengii]
MTAADATTGTDAAPPIDLVTLTIDGRELQVPKGTLIIRAAEMIGTQIPRFCDHPLLDPVGACRQCIVEVEGQRKPVASCTTPVADGMVVTTQLTSPVAEKAQRGVMELLLINHPLDCPVCDKGGECPLQNQAMSTGRTESRFGEEKRTYPKPIPLSSEILLDRERCVLCARCTRFSGQIAGDPFIDLLERGALQQVGIYANEPFESYFSGNTIQVCPVGALTSTAYRFRARPFDLVSSPSVCEHCADGCAQRTDHRRGKVLRRLAGDDPAVNEEWNCDKGRFAFTYTTQGDRITTPLIRNADGELIPASWPMALDLVARSFAQARGDAGVLVGGRSTLEDAYAYGKFARVALATNNIDFRIRAHSAEEAGFLSAHVAGRTLEESVTYQDLESAPAALLVALEPEEESPIIFLRLRKAARFGKTTVLSSAPFATRGLKKMGGSLLRTVPGSEAALMDSLSHPSSEEGQLLRQPGAVILLGERLSEVAGGFAAAVRLAEATGACLAWVPRRAGDRGAVEAGALPGLLPGGRPVADPAARQEVESVWGASIPASDGRDAASLLDPGQTTAALLVGGVELSDLPNPAKARAAIEAAGFVVSLEIRHSGVTELADVVFPVAPVAEKPGTFLDWEGRERVFDTALRTTGVMPDQRVLHAIAAEMGIDLGLPDADSARSEIHRLGAWSGSRPISPQVPSGTMPTPALGEAVLSSWRMLLDNGRLQDGEPNLAGTARLPLVRLSAETAAEIGADNGDHVAVSTESGSITLPLEITELPPRTVWLPLNSPGSTIYETLCVTAGSVVKIAKAGAQ